jgi:hypothetical protein
MGNDAPEYMALRIKAGNGNETLIAEAFESEDTHSFEQQRSGRQAIQYNFRKNEEGDRNQFRLFT